MKLAPKTTVINEAPFFFTPYNHDTQQHSKESAILCLDPSLTKQEFTLESDPNYIIDRFVKGGDITLNPRKPQYGDFTNAPSSYHEALNLVREAEQSFMALDAKIRAKFNNDPEEFLQFVGDPANAEQLIELGLAEKPLYHPVSPGSSERAHHAGADEPGDTSHEQRDSAPQRAPKSKGKGSGETD